MSTAFDQLTRYFPSCRRILGKNAWERILSAADHSDPKTVVSRLKILQGQGRIPSYLADLAGLELACHKLSQNWGTFPDPEAALAVNPALELVPVSFCHLPLLLTAQGWPGGEAPKKEETRVLVWRHPQTGKVLCRDAGDEDLLALKLVVEAMDVRAAARAGNTTVAKVMAVLLQALDQGLLVSPGSRIRREGFPGGEDRFLRPQLFTLQWHITQACDLHCRHCYDRSDRVRLSGEEARAVLEDFFDFTQAMQVRGHVTFTGGNPLLHPGVATFYQRAADLGFSTAILGNPASDRILDTLESIQPMTHFQISLEGLKPYNDYIRGPGHFKRSLDFLDQLRNKGIFSMVMLTLNRDNLDQVLPLARILKGRADSFTFNRLSMVGEGAGLRLPDPSKFKAFLGAYLDAAKTLPFLSLKDNLFNPLNKERGRPLFGGCTGHGCGAAFNFVSLLPDGEVHACRKFPSLLGNIRETPLLEIYNSALAQTFRQGARACQGCDLSALCRGCPAVVYGMGLDPHLTRDPFCFYAAAPGQAT